MIDSLRGAHDGDENNSSVAKVLQKLTGLAERTKAAVVVIHHTRKIGIDEDMSANSSRGSNAIFAMARSLIGIDKPDPDSDWCRAQILKENLGLKPNPIGFLIAKKGVEFGKAPRRPQKRTEKDRAVDWLIEYLEPGRWVPASEVLDQGKQDGFSANAIQRAREEIGIVKPKYVRRKGKSWEWQRPKTN